MCTIIWANNVNNEEIQVNGATAIRGNGEIVTKDHDITLAEVCDMVGCDYKRYRISLSGTEMSAADLNVTPAQKGLTGRVFLMTLAKTDNA